MGRSFRGNLKLCGIYSRVGEYINTKKYYANVKDVGINGWSCLIPFYTERAVPSVQEI